jgi:hypothetical protein
VNDAQKAKLAAKLSGDTKFDKNYTAQNRAWFARAIVDAVAAAKPDAQVEGEAKRIIGEAHKRVAADRDVTVGLTFDAGTELYERSDVKRRVETIYGVIAQAPALAETAQDELRRFIVRRRYRGVMRMVFDVNPNANGYFRYRGACDEPTLPDRAGWRTNVDARNLWETFTPADAPLRVKVPTAGAADPKAAAEKLWIAHDVACEGNLFDCAHALCCVLMDSLFEADDDDKLFKAIYARGRAHLTIYNPSQWPEQYFLWERPTEPRRLFSTEEVLPADLQVGDHVYIWNHGLYPQVIPGGEWSGEHAIVTDTGTRKFGDGKGFLFSGHGLDVPETVEQLHDRLVKELQTALHRIYAIARIFLLFRSTGNASIPASQWGDALLQTTTPAGTTLDVIAYEVLVDVQYGDYISKPRRDGSPPLVTEPGFIAFEIPALKAIAISPQGINSIADQMQIGLRLRTTQLIRTAEPAAGVSPYERTLWQIAYRDSDTDTEQKFPLFGGAKGTLRLLDRKEMPKFKFARLRATDAGALVTRPTVDASATYTAFLRTSGALA